MRIMAIQAGHPRLTHPAETKPRLAIVFIALHTVGPKDTGLNGQNQLKVVIKFFANGEFMVKLIPSGMAYSIKRDSLSKLKSIW